MEKFVETIIVPQKNKKMIIFTTNHVIAINRDIFVAVSNVQIPYLKELINSYVL
jgi:hypothetical protein